MILLGDCYYLPHEEGPEAVALYESARDSARAPPCEWGRGAASFRDWKDGCVTYASV